MRILVDAMGGDNAPDQIALGAIQAAKDFGWSDAARRSCVR